MEQKTTLSKEFFSILNCWMFMKNQGKNIGDVLKKLGVSKIAIYGMGDMARHITNELEGTNCEVVAYIDSEKKYYYDQIYTVTIDAYDKKGELIIYTNPFESEEILDELKNKGKTCYLGDLIFDNVNI